MAYSLIGKDYTPPDIHAKVTGTAKYAEDFKVDGGGVLSLAHQPHTACPCGQHRCVRGDTRRSNINAERE